MNREQFEELLFQTLEHEKGGVQVYTTALKCAVNEDLKEEWEKYLGETENHVELATKAITALGLDPEKETPGRAVVRFMGESLVAAMEKALKSGLPGAAQLVACEAVVLAETKDHLDWELIGECLKTLTGDEKKAVEEAYEIVEDQEDEHYYHSAGWCRELWLESLGLPAVLPPPEEQKHVETAIGAARAKQQRGDMISSSRSKRGKKKTEEAKSE